MTAIKVSILVLFALFIFCLIMLRSDGRTIRNLEEKRVSDSTYFAGQVDSLRHIDSCLVVILDTMINVLDKVDSVNIKTDSTNRQMYKWWSGFKVNYPFIEDIDNYLQNPKDDVPAK